MQIHELNNYNGSLDAGAFLAVDNGTDTGKISVDGLLSSTKNEINDVETTLNGRIDNIVAGGDAPSAAEIVDARRGVDGVNYSSLGDAIRNQAENLQQGIVALAERKIVTIEETVSVGSNLFTLTDSIPKGTTVFIENLSTDTTATINFRDADNVDHNVSNGLGPNTSIEVVAPCNVLTIRSYCNNTNWHLRLTYGDDVIDKIKTNQEDITELHFADVSRNSTNKAEVVTAVRPGDGIYYKDIEIGKGSFLLILNRSEGGITCRLFDAEGNYYDVAPAGIPGNQYRSAIVPFDVVSCRFYSNQYDFDFVMSLNLTPSIDGFINATAFGAVGDNTTDNTKSLQACMDYCADNGFKCYIPNGVYLVSDPLVNKGVHIIGAGMAIQDNPACTILKASASINGIITFDRDVTQQYNMPLIRDLTIEGDNKANYGIVMTRSCRTQRIYCRGALIAGLVSRDAYDCDIKDSIFNHNGRYGVYLTMRNNNFMITSCIINDNGTLATDANLMIENTSASAINNNNNVKVIACEIDGATHGYSISLDGVDVFTLDKCYSEQFDQSFMHIGETYGSVITNITNCYFLDTKIDIDIKGSFIGNMLNLINKNSGIAKIKVSEDSAYFGNYIHPGYSEE